MKYSVCITSRNNERTVRRALDSLLANLDRNTTEIVVVDAESTDGQQDILREYASKGLLKLIVRRCNRGEGRQLAFENSTGDYVISGVDTDDTIGPGFQPLLSRYHSEFEGKVLVAGILIAPRSVLRELGGWKPFQHGEDYDLWTRAKKANLFTQIPETPFAIKARHESGVFDVAGSLWRYLEQGRKPVLSWKSWPLYAAVKIVWTISHLGRQHKRAD